MSEEKVDKKPALEEIALLTFCVLEEEDKNGNS